MRRCRGASAFSFLIASLTGALAPDVRASQRDAQSYIVSRTRSPCQTESRVRLPSLSAALSISPVNSVFTAALINHGAHGQHTQAFWPRVYAKPHNWVMPATPARYANYTGPYTKTTPSGIDGSHRCDIRNTAMYTLATRNAYGGHAAAYTLTTPAVYTCHAAAHTLTTRGLYIMVAWPGVGVRARDRG